MLPTRRLVTGQCVSGTALPSRGPNRAAGEYVVHRQRNDTGMEHIQKSVLLQQEQLQQVLLLSDFV